MSGFEEFVEQIHEATGYTGERLQHAAYIASAVYADFVGLAEIGDHFMSQIPGTVIPGATASEAAAIARRYFATVKFRKRKYPAYVAHVGGTTNDPDKAAIYSSPEEALEAARQLAKSGIFDVPGFVSIKDDYKAEDYTLMPSPF